MAINDYPDHETISREDFDSLARARQFAVGPFRDTFGDGPGEPYNPFRWLHGTLKDGRRVKAKFGTEWDAA